MKKALKTLGAALLVALCANQAQAVKVYYNNPDNWTDVAVYVYEDGGSATNKAWPGEKATKETNGLWSYTIPAALESKGVVIFNDNKKDNAQQFPYNGGTTNLKVSGKDMICHVDKNNEGVFSLNAWTEYINEKFVVYFDNSNKKWATPAVHYFGASESTWPGVKMAAVADHAGIFSYEVPAGTCCVIFTDGNKDTSNQTGTYIAKPTHKYNESKDQGAYVPGEVAKPYTVYFDNTLAGWANPYIFYFGADEPAWPGVKMVAHNGKIWKYEVPAGTTGILFNAGDGDATKTQDFDAVADHVYTQTADKGDIKDYTVTVEMPKALYILGTVGETSWATTPGIVMTKEGNTFKAANVTLNAASKTDDFSYFTFVTTVGASWDIVNGADRYGANAENAPLTDNKAAMVKYANGVNASSAKSWKVEAGIYDIVANFETMEVSVTKAGEIERPVAGNGSISVPDVTVNPGKDANIEVILTAEKVMRSIQLEVEVPAQVTAGTPKLSHLVPNHELQHNNVDGKLKITITSSTGESFKLKDGVLFYLPVTAAANAAAGEYNVKFTNIILSDVDALRTNADDVTSKVIVEAVAATEIQLSNTQLALQIGDHATLTGTVLPADTPDKTITWSTDKPAVATVNATTGEVIAVAKGTAVITATCGAATATCTVTVGKTPQTITWDQDLSATLGVGDEVELSASASSKLAVEFTITNGSAYATITDGKLVATAPGIVTVMASQAGDDTFAPAEPIAKTITIWRGYFEGDANGDKAVTLADATATVNYILGRNPENFNVAAADIDADNEITVADYDAIIDILLAQQATTEPTAVRARANATSLEQFTIAASDDYSVRVNFTNMSNYVATMFEVILPEGVSVKNAYITGSDHNVAYRQLTDNVTRVVITSMNNSNFAANGTISFIFNDAPQGIVELNNAVLNATDGKTVDETMAAGARLDMSQSSAISAIEAEIAQGVEYFTLQGLRVVEPKAGNVYIRRAGNEVSKVIL